MGDAVAARRALNATTPATIAAHPTTSAVIITGLSFNHELPDDDDDDGTVGVMTDEPSDAVVATSLVPAAPLLVVPVPAPPATAPAS